MRIILVIFSFIFVFSFCYAQPIITDVYKIDEEKEIKCQHLYNEAQDKSIKYDFENLMDALDILYEIRSDYSDTQFYNQNKKEIEGLFGFLITETNLKIKQEMETKKLPYEYKRVALDVIKKIILKDKSKFEGIPKMENFLIRSVNATVKITVFGVKHQTVDEENIYPIYSGSGFVINKSGKILTNYHILKDALSYRSIICIVEFPNENIAIVDYVAGTPSLDIAIMEIDKDFEIGFEFESVELGDSSNLQVGQEVFAIGAPLGLAQSVTKGIVSAVDRGIEGRRYIQTDAAINAGNSGGPLVDNNGKVVGINTLAVQKGIGEGLGFAIPIDEAIESFGLKNGEYNITQQELDGAVRAENLKVRKDKYTGNVN